MLYARTNAEAHLYMDLHPCGCGETDFERDSVLVADGDDLVSVYEGACAGCGAARKFEFTMAEELPRAPRGVVFGGDEPSRIIDPGQYLAVSDERARCVPGSPAGLSAADLARARRDIASAIAAVSEVAKFIPPGEDSVPVESFRSEESKDLYLRDPGRFERFRLEAVLDAYRAIATALGS